MTRYEKMISRMRNNPFGNWQIDTLKAIAARRGIEAIHEGSSHVVFRTPDGRQISVPAHRPIKAVYIKTFLELLED
ncbi:MAG: hypothetical protein HQL83_02195 [Magnetococcales bacterium]|nr:hypothetical protein [Magnetococcales bacterium]MBF0346270.1 hypothetical protein [Magnetococcales bacterium]MBF0631549.1 hypothetical protein [Magnetococcales bacterium]